MKDNWVSFLCLIFTLIASTAFGITGKPTEMGLSIVAGAICMAFANIDKIQRFKGAGFEAEMRKVVEEADVTIENLRGLAKPLILSTLDILTMTGRWGGMDSQQKHKLKLDLERIAKLFPLDDEEIKSAQEKFHRYHTWDHLSRFIRAVAKEKSPSKDIMDQLFALRDYKSSNFPNEEEIKSQLGQFSETLSPETMELLQDYNYYREKGQLRREEALKGE